MEKPTFSFLYLSCKDEISRTYKGTIYPINSFLSLFPYVPSSNLSAFKSFEYDANKILPQTVSTHASSLRCVYAKVKVILSYLFLKTYMQLKIDHSRNKCFPLTAPIPVSNEWNSSRSVVIDSTKDIRSRLAQTREKYLFWKWPKSLITNIIIQPIYNVCLCIKAMA